ncbi:MAG: M48 family metalloprotease [Pseudomonadota bacterium]
MKRILLIGILVAHAAFADNLQLPDLGDHADNLLTPQQENWIGEAAWFELHREQLVDDDPVIQTYVSQLGHSLVGHRMAEAGNLTFFIIKDPSINAFAMPGGYIAVHTGLIMRADSEDELAAVLAHELAHLKQRHITQLMGRNASHQLTSIAGLIMAGLLASQNVMAGTGLLAATLASHTQSMINYTRQHEEEADAVGIRLLADAGYNPDGMAQFFQKLIYETRGYNNQIPEYLSTHPITESRMMNANLRAKKLQRSPRDHSMSAQQFLWIRQYATTTEKWNTVHPTKTLDMH